MKMKNILILLIAFLYAVFGGQAFADEPLAPEESQASVSQETAVITSATMYPNCPGHIMSAGSVLNFWVKAVPSSKVTVAMGQRFVDCMETAPGFYQGVYTVQYADNYSGPAVAVCEPKEGQAQRMSVGNVNMCGTRVPVITFIDFSKNHKELRPWTAVGTATPGALVKVVIEIRKKALFIKETDFYTATSFADINGNFSVNGFIESEQSYSTAVVKIITEEPSGSRQESEEYKFEIKDYFSS